MKETINRNMCGEVYTQQDKMKWAGLVGLDVFSKGPRSPVVLMTLKTLKSEVEAYPSEWFLLLGNGINRLAPESENLAGLLPSWSKLLIGLLDEQSHSSFLHLADEKTDLTGLTYPELFELILADRNRGLSYGSKITADDLKKEVCTLCRAVASSNEMKATLAWAMNKRMPILTTNYDLSLERAAAQIRPPPKPNKYFLSLRDSNKNRNSKFYHWHRYWAPTRLANPMSDFGIWHLHGAADTPESIRISLNDYAGSLQRARKTMSIFIRWLQNGGTLPLELERSPLPSSCLEIFMHKKPVIIGLGLRTQEIFLRWLLLRKTVLCSKEPSAQRGGYLILPRKDKELWGPGTSEFLESCGIVVIAVEGEPPDVYKTCYSWMRP